MAARRVSGFAVGTRGGVGAGRVGKTRLTGLGLRLIELERGVVFMRGANHVVCDDEPSTVSIAKPRREIPARRGLRV